MKPAPRSDGWLYCPDCADYRPPEEFYMWGKYQSTYCKTHSNRRTAATRKRSAAEQSGLPLDLDGQVCRECGNWKPWEAYNKGRYSNGHQPVCRECQAWNNHAQPSGLATIGAGWGAPAWAQATDVTATWPMRQPVSIRRE